MPRALPLTRPARRPLRALALALLAPLALLTGRAAAAEPAPAAADAPDPTYLAALLQRAEAEGLADDPRWLALVQYDPRWLPPGLASDASSDAFYLSPAGRRDPHAELAATLAAFFEAGAVVKEEPLQCAFRARFTWLDARLHFDPARLPRATCTAYETWRRELGGAAISLIFPVAFMGSPSSMFGHTLLRVDRTAEESPDNLSAYALDFTADTGGESGPIYLAKGLLGRYPGYFGVHPYYEKTQLYGDWQNRDIWEYRLDLTPAEVDFLLAYVWELRAVFFPYWFLDENCSYRLLRLLEATRPDLDLTRGLGPLVLPVDTVRKAVAVPGLLRGVHFRPSPVTEIRFRLRDLSPEARRAARRVGRGEIEPSDPELAALGERDRAAALAIAYDYLRWRFVNGEVGEAESRPRALAILRARSRIGPAPDGAPLFAATPVPDVRPEQGHGTARVSLGGGIQNREAFVEARARWAVHDLMDPQGGYPPGSQIDFMALRLRWYPSLAKWRFDEAVLLDVRSLAPRDDFFQPLSWRFDVGMRTRLFDASAPGLGDPNPVGRASGGVGGSWALGEHVTAYALAEGTFDVGPALEHAVALGPGAVVGAYAGTAGDRWRGHLYGRVRGFVLGDTTVAATIGSEQRITLSERLALGLDAAWQRDFGQSWFEGSLDLHFYF